MDMKKLLTIPVLMALAPMAQADIQGISGTACAGATSACFDLTAKAGHIMLGDGNSLLTWGYAEADGVMQYPGPTLFVNQGDVVQVTLANTLSEPVSIVFPGQSAVTATGGTAGLITNEAAPAGTVTYTFIAEEPGTYLYQSGTHPETQIEMGLVGAMIVRPAGFDVDTNRTAYGTPATAYDREYLFFLTDMDRSAHEGLDGGFPIDPASYAATLWFINGRNGPDTMHVDNAPWLPNQPYGALVSAEPSDRVLMRLVGGGRDLHPFHHHGNNTWQIAQDGRVLESAPGATGGYPDFVETVGTVQNWLPDGVTLPDESVSNYTITVVPGNTYDAIFTWTGRDLNWDIYGNAAGHNSSGLCDESTRLADEDPNSHCKEIPVQIPEQQALTFGGLWSGSPFLGTVGTLPPLQGGLNPNGGFSFMWHSHTERELTNDDIFPGGMMTMMIIEAYCALPDPDGTVPAVCTPTPTP
jgi:hypothetical protein